MEVDSNFSSLLRNLKVDDPWIPPKTWESIPSESGAARSGDTGHGSQDISDLSTVSEAVLVRLVLNALHGVKAALVEIEKLSIAFCSSPADRTFHHVPTLWCRSTSTIALGKMLKSICHSGLLFFFLHNFVNYNLCASHSVIVERGDKDSGGGNQKDAVYSEIHLIPSDGEGHHKNEMNMKPPYSLVNQAFSVAVGKVLEGYLCALNTLLSSVKLRRSLKSVNAPEQSFDGAGSLTSVVHAEITVLEVYLHTRELRTLIEALGNICFLKIADLASSREVLTTDTNLEFHDFPRGADLLTYLYVQLRDADPVHHELLKFLFVRSCEPYCGFIKSWIYRASTDDPYAEFFVLHSDYLPTSNCTVGSIDDVSLASIKERNCISVPCFLKEFCQPLLRAGQQLQVLVKMLNMCNSAVIGAYVPCGLGNLEDILPFWSGMSSDSVLQNPIIFSKKGIEALIYKREIMYRTMMEKLQIFFTKLDVRFQRMNHNVIPLGIAQSLNGKRKGAFVPFSLVSDWDLNWSRAANELGDTNFLQCEGSAFSDSSGAGHQDTEASSTSDGSLYEVGSLNASESSSLYSSEDEIETEGLLELHAAWCTNKNILLNSSGAKGLYSAQVACHSNCERIGPVTPAAHQHFEKFSQISSLQSEATECVRMSKTLDSGFQSGECWPLGGLLKNPFYTDTMNRGMKQLHFTGYDLQMTDGNIESLKEEESYDGEMFVIINSELDPMRRIQMMNGMHKRLSSCIHQSWKYHDYYDLSINPMLAKPAWLRTVRNSRDRSSINNNGSFFPYFDFSSIADPCKAYSENVVSGPGCGAQVESPMPVVTVCSDVELNEFSGDVRDTTEPLSVPNSVCSSRKANLLSCDVPTNASGGANWEGLLQYSGEDVTLNAGDVWRSSVETFEIPLDIMIEKCIVQEILLQYKYVSSFTIKLLEEGFDLREHLLALRRYHFMELADWADSFIISLCNQKWSVIEPEQKITEIQGLLDLALQRSSCESDHCKERLYVYMKEFSTTPQSTSSSGVHAFDNMLLGYKVDWPVSIIVTQVALSIYAEIFSYLIQVRLAVFSLSDAWHSLKALMHLRNHGRLTGSAKMKYFNILTKIRQQINHFVSTLQQYMHSQLSDVSWCRFQHSLKHQVKDMLDLEMLHRRYLADALHICFLSVETKTVATIIKNILQCALDFRLCFNGVEFDVVSDGADPSNLGSQIDFSQVLAVKATFEKNIKDLYLLYLRSPKHGEFGLGRFWGYLNYNDYYSTTIGRETWQSIA